MSLERQLLIESIDAASTATIHAGSHTDNAYEVRLLNEQWVQSYVGLAINDCLRQRYRRPDQGFISFETNVAWLEDLFEHVRGRGRKPGKLTDRQRFDVVVWSKGGSVLGLVEIKDQPFMQSYSRTADAQKLCQALKRWPKLKWGMFIFSVRSSRLAGKRDIPTELAMKSEQVFDEIASICGSQVRYRETKIVPGKGSALMWGGVTFRRST